METQLTMQTSACCTQNGVRNRKCLIITDTFPPNHGPGAKRMGAVAKNLAKLGWNVHILTLKEEYRDSTDENRKYISHDVNVIRTRAIFPTRYSYPKLSIMVVLREIVRWILSCLYIPDLTTGWIPIGLKVGNNIIKRERIDIIYSSAPRFSCHLLALLLKRMTKVPWVAEFRDPWSNHPKFLHKNIFKRKIEKILEQKVLEESDNIISISPIMSRQFIEINNFRDEEKFHVITNGYDICNVPEIRSEQSTIFTICYTGTFRPPLITPDYFLEAVKKLLETGAIQKNKIKINFFGDFPRRSQRLVQETILSSVTSLHKYVSHEESLRQQRLNNLLLLLIDPQGPKWVITSKVFEYLVSSRPILALTCEGAEVEMIINETNTGKVILGNKVDDIADAILDYYKKFYKNRGKLDYSPRFEEIKKYDYRFLTKKIDKILKKAIEDARLKGAV